MRLKSNRGKPFMHIKADDRTDVPVFSEAFLYSCMTKNDARFILGVADEYNKLIEILGFAKTNKLLAGEE